MQGTHTLHPLVRFCRDITPDLAQAMGPGFEVVVHDLSRPESSIIAIAGDVTGRQVGGPLTDLGLRLLKSNRTNKNLLNYETKTSDGKTLRSSTLFIHDEQGKTIGCLCINQDITPWVFVRGLVSSMCEVGDSTPPGVKTEESFPTDVEELLHKAVHQAVEEAGKPVSVMSRNDKIRIVGNLDDQGIFQIRGAASHVARALGVSRCTIYNYLGEALHTVDQGT